MAVIESSAAQTSIFPVRVLRIWGGSLALAFDALAATVREPGALLEHAELRGVRVRRVLQRRWAAIGGSRDLAHLTATALQPVRWVQREVSATGASSAEEVERQVEKVLERMGIPSRERLEKLSREIEGLSAKIDQELAAMLQVEHH